MSYPVFLPLPDFNIHILVNNLQCSDTAPVMFIQINKADMMVAEWTPLILSR